MIKMEYKTVRYKAMMWVTDPAGGMNPRSIQDYVNSGWHIKEIQIEKDDEVTFFLERPAALGALVKLQDVLRFATSEQFDMVYGSGLKKKNPDKCPYCGNVNTGNMEHEHDCPYGTLIRLEAKARELIDEVT